MPPLLWTSTGSAIVAIADPPVRCAGCGRSAAILVNCNGVTLCADCSSDSHSRSVSPLPDYDRNAGDYDDGQPSEQQEWQDFDPDC